VEMPYRILIGSLSMTLSDFRKAKKALQKFLVIFFVFLISC